jgi:hypothetical protein
MKLGCAPKPIGCNPEWMVQFGPSMLLQSESRAGLMPKRRGGMSAAWNVAGTEVLGIAALLQRLFSECC